MTLPTLPQLTALARAGAAGRAWALFVDAGYDQRGADPAALAVKGRLLKGRARLADGDERRSLLSEAAAAYQAANQLAPAPYLAINAASLRLLAGDAEGARSGAAGVLTLLGDPASAIDTPYFLAATRAEAQLLLGNQAQAEAAMADAAHADPDGWADRAATTAQLREIAAAQGRDAAWIDRFTPPASLHFAGHMGIAAGGTSERQLQAALAAHFASHPVGFAWGALAAGADVIIAEALVAAGAELHVVLPCPAAQFEAQSVRPAGAGWSERFTALMAKAASVRTAADTATSVHDPLATAHAGDLAIGGALSNAARFAARAEQLIVFDEAGGGSNTARQAERWKAASGLQTILTIPRDAAVDAMFAPEQHDPARQLAVYLCAAHEDLAQGFVPAGDRLETIAAAVAQACSDLPRGSVRAGPNGWEITALDVDAALSAAQRLTAVDGMAVGAHLAIGPLIADPASGALVPFGPAPALARRLAALAHSGTALASDALAVTLCARGASDCHSELYYPREDELGGPVHLLTS